MHVDQGGSSHLIIAQDALELADRPVAEDLQPCVDLIASLIGQQSKLRLAPTGLTAWSAQQQAPQSREALETVREWIDQINPRFSFEMAERYTTARAISDAEVAAAQATKE